MPHDQRPGASTLTFRVAVRLRSDGVGTGHLLLALAEEETLAGERGTLARLGLDATAAERYVTGADPEPAT